MRDEDFAAALDELEQLHRKASPAPWALGIIGPEYDPVEVHRKNLSRGSGNVWLVFLPEHPLATGTREQPDAYVTAAITGNGPTSEVNARFLCAMRDLFPEMLARLERATKGGEEGGEGG